LFSIMPDTKFHTYAIPQADKKTKCS
jgi:hypothetical protein